MSASPSSLAHSASVFGDRSTRPFGPDSVPTESQISFELGSTMPFMISLTVPTGVIAGEATVAAGVAVPADALLLASQAAPMRALTTIRLEQIIRIQTPQPGQRTSYVRDARVHLKT